MQRCQCLAIAVWFKEPNLAIFKIRESFVILLWVKFTCPNDSRAVNIGVVENPLPVRIVVRSIAHDDQVLARYLVQLPLDFRCAWVPRPFIPRPGIRVGRSSYQMVSVEAGCEKEQKNTRPRQSDSGWPCTNANCSQMTDSLDDQAVDHTSKGSSVVWHGRYNGEYSCEAK